MTGHAGGSLTHGSNFLNPPSPEFWFSSQPAVKRQITLNNTIYEAVSVILEEKCYTCHGKSKKKGKLRLDTKEGLLQGGKSGGLISDEKLLLKRILLSPDDEDHMPPKEKKQLSEDEINFLIWWVENGADFDHSLVDLNLPDSLEGILSTEEIFTENALIPSEGVEPAAEDVLAKLHNLGVVVTPVGAESDYLSVNFINVEKERVSAAAEAMTEIRKQVIFLNLDYQSLDQEAWDKIGLLINLRKLSARNSNLSDESISALQHLTELVTLNFVGTDLTVNGLLRIKNLNKLQSIYLYQTALNHQDFERTATAFPGVRLDSGNYMVPTWASDTLVFKK
jgi:hypothetical protein